MSVVWFLAGIAVWPAVYAVSWAAAWVRYWRGRR
jgi:hypothetical protein